MLTAGQPLVHDYRPTAEDIRQCSRCGEPCVPFPNRESTICAFCRYEVAVALGAFDAGAASIDWNMDNLRAAFPEAENPARCLRPLDVTAATTAHAPACCHCECRELNCVTLYQRNMDGGHRHYSHLPCPNAATAKEPLLCAEGAPYSGTAEMFGVPPPTKAPDPESLCIGCAVTLPRHAENRYCSDGCVGRFCSADCLLAHLFKKHAGDE